MNKWKKEEEIPRILIVDDISMNVEIMKEIIESEGYEALCALSVEEAIQIMMKTQPSLILSDLSMPEVDGLEFCKMVKSNPRTREIPFVFISVLDTTEEKEQAFRAGAVDFIPKPFERVEVIMRVNNHLSAYTMKREMNNFNRMMHRLVEEQKKQIEKEQRYVLSALALFLEKMDPDREEHLENVGYNCRLLAQSLQFLPEYENEITDEFVDTIEVAAKLHEIGSILWDSERAEKGICLLEEMVKGRKSQYLEMAIRIIRYRNARWDGTGTPEAKGDDIPLEARIAAVADDFDTPCKEEAGGNISQEEMCIQRIKDCGGTLYDPQIVEVFDKIWRQMRRS